MSNYMRKHVKLLSTFCSLLCVIQKPATAAIPLDFVHQEQSPPQSTTRPWILIEDDLPENVIHLSTENAYAQLATFSQVVKFGTGECVAEMGFYVTVNFSIESTCPLTTYHFINNTVTTLAE